MFDCALTKHHRNKCFSAGVTHRTQCVVGDEGRFTFMVKRWSDESTITQPIEDWMKAGTNQTDKWRSIPMERQSNGTGQGMCDTLNVFIPYTLGFKQQSGHRQQSGQSMSCPWCLMQSLDSSGFSPCYQDVLLEWSCSLQSLLWHHFPVAFKELNY